MHSQQPKSIHRFFSGLAEHTFQTRLGVADPPLVDYVAGLLTRFVRNDTMLGIRDGRGRRLVQVAEMLVEAQQRVGDARREIHQHIGDYTLFWSGLYPETIEKKTGLGKMDQLLDYPAQGKRAYWIASTIESETGETPAEILERLSERFELCVYGLHEIRREWERRDDEDNPRPFLLN